MANRENVGSHAVDEQVHQDFRGGFSGAFQMAAVGIDDDQVVGLEHTLIHACGGGKNAAAGKTYGDVALASDDEAALVHPAANHTNIAAMLLFAFLNSGQH